MIDPGFQPWYNYFAQFGLLIGWPFLLLNWFVSLDAAFAWIPVGFMLWIVLNINYHIGWFAGGN